MQCRPAVSASGPVGNEASGRPVVPPAYPKSSPDMDEVEEEVSRAERDMRVGTYTGMLRGDVR